MQKFHTLQVIIINPLLIVFIQLLIQLGFLFFKQVKITSTMKKNSAKRFASDLIRKTEPQTTFQIRLVIGITFLYDLTSVIFQLLMKEQGEQ